MIKKSIVANAIASLILLGLSTSCTEDEGSGKMQGTFGKTYVQANTHSPDILPVRSNKLAKDISNIFQDKKGDFWFTTYGQGLFYFDGYFLYQFTTKDGLCSNFISEIQEDQSGNLWLNTGEGLCRFDGKYFSNYNDTLKNVSIENLQFNKEDLFFCYDGLVYRYDGEKFTKFSIHPSSYEPSSNNLDRPYGVYCMLKDKSGNLWFGTDQKGVVRYDGKTFAYFTEHGLSKAAVRAIFQDKNDNIWFGNNGYGLFFYDGKTLSNFTEEKRLENPNFVNQNRNTNIQPNLARVWAIDEDKEGNLWVGTIDNGVWRYDGKHLKNYTIKDGLPNNKIISMYKDKKNTLWFVTEGEGIIQFNGHTFSKFAPINV